MIVIPIWQVCTCNTPKLLSHLPVFWWCLNVRTLFLYPRKFEKYPTSKPNRGMTIEPKYAHMWVRPSVCLSAQAHMKT